MPACKSIASAVTRTRFRFIMVSMNRIQTLLIAGLCPGMLLTSCTSRPAAVTGPSARSPSTQSAPPGRQSIPPKHTTQPQQTNTSTPTTAANTIVTIDCQTLEQNWAELYTRALQYNTATTGQIEQPLNVHQVHQAIQRAHRHRPELFQPGTLTEDQRWRDQTIQYIQRHQRDKKPPAPRWLTPAFRQWINQCRPQTLTNTQLLIIQRLIQPNTGAGP